jgi:hypothetical protein
MAEAAFINNNAVWPRSDPDVSSSDHIQGEQPLVNGWCHALNAAASVRRLGDDTPGQRGRHDNSPSSGKGDGRLSGPYSLQSSSQRPISEARCDPMVGPEGQPPSFDRVSLCKWQSRRMPLRERISAASERLLQVPDSPDPSRERTAPASGRLERVTEQSERTE